MPTDPPHSCVNCVGECDLLNPNSDALSGWDQIQDIGDPKEVPGDEANL